MKKSNLTNLEKLTLIIFHERIFYLCDPIRWKKTGYCSPCSFNRNRVCNKILNSLKMIAEELNSSDGFKQFKNEIERIIEEIANGK